MNIQRPQSRQSMPDDAKRVFKGEVFDVYQWEQTVHDGTIKTFERLKRADTILIIPVTDDNRIIILEEEQPGKPSYIGLVGGRADEDENPLEAGKRELLEETGYEATDWTLFDAVQPLGKIEWAVYTFIARGCRKVADQKLDGAEKIDVHLVSFDEFIKLASKTGFADMEFKLKILEAKLDPVKMKKLKALLVD